MKRIRIGNDINVVWSLMRDDAPFLLNAEKISLYLMAPYGRVELTDYSVEGNSVTWLFQGRHQKAIGKYTLVLVVNKGEEGMITTDACDFVELVSCSCKADGADACGVETEYVNLVSKIDVGGASGGGSSYDDTEIRTELSRLDAVKADKSELTELSTEVGGLSEKVDNLPTAESSVFEAIYGETTYEEIWAAYKNGKHCLCVYDNQIYNLIIVKENDNLLFSCSRGEHIYTLTCAKTNLWWSGLTDLQTKSNKTTTISESSTDTQYPSAKAVYDAIQSAVTNELNSDF